MKSATRLQLAIIALAFFSSFAYFALSQTSVSRKDNFTDTAGISALSREE